MTERASLALAHRHTGRVVAGSGAVRDAGDAAGTPGHAAAGAVADSRRRVVERYAPPALLGFGLALSVATSGLVGMDRADWYVAGAAVAAAAVLEAWAWRAEPGRTGASRAGAVYYGVRWALAFVLSWLNPFFVFYASVGFIGADGLLPPRVLRWGVGATAVTLAVAQSSGLREEGPVRWVLFGGLLVFNWALIEVIGHLESAADERARAQAATIVELERSNEALRQALEENAALHARLVLQAREMGIADERQRLAAEIHDTLAQGLTGIIAQLRAVTAGTDPGQVREHVDRAAELARHSLGEARRSVHDLAPSALDDEELPEALEGVVEAWSRRTGVPASWTVTGTVTPLHDEIQATVLRIAEEALANVARHAGADRVGVTLSYMDDEVTLDVRDDGRGFDLRSARDRAPGDGFGLRGMRARAERVAGEVVVESAPGAGTAVSARVPLVGHDQ